MTTHSGRFIVFRRGKNDADVVRIAAADGGGWTEESRHKIADGACDCAGFKHRRTCAHFDAATEHGKPVSLDEARTVAGEVIAVLGDGASLPDEPYERGPDGSVVRVHVRLRDKATKGVRIRALWKGVEVEVEAANSFGGR